MQTFPLISLATLALSAGTVLAAPTGDAVTDAPGQSPNDQIYRNLAAAGQLHWTEANGGQTATILKEHWDAAAGAIAARSATGPDPGLARRDGVSGGDIEGLITSLSCYGRGATAQDSEIQRFAIKACDVLVGANVPEPAKKALQVWQSTDFADVNGIQGYLRYSFEVLNDIAEKPDPALCTGAMNMFAALCQKGNGGTQGGENKVGEVYKFNVDPTDDNNNY